MEAPRAAGTEVDRLMGTEVAAALTRHVDPAAVRTDLAACLDAIATRVCASPSVIPPELTGVLAGGKRLRPLLVLAVVHSAGRASPAARRRAVGAATAVELLHVASLVHDDIMDGAAVRHHAATINARAGNGRALLAGDLLIGHAHAAAAEVGAAAAGIIGSTLVRLCEGQAEETSARYDVGRTERSYRRAIAGKTGSLFDASCRLGAIAAGRDAATADALGRFGMRLGIAFQLADDLLDAEPARVLDKPVGQDLAAGVYTYPTLWAMRRDPQLRGLLSRLDGRAGTDRARLLDEAALRIRCGGALVVTRQVIERQLTRSLRSLGALGGAGVALLEDVARAVGAPRGPDSSAAGVPL
ncbi:polyprenyl synthetase family protein [Dactylosporangium sp. NPDC005572]|uniref:polyprenyl synthetase family protein n=1 Tax=Dactylosporangium sp. NPDC005572 TaxID=3156889 RepID=UPI0033BA5D67